MGTRIGFARWTAVSAIALFATVACSASTESAPSILEGLTQGAVRDSAGNTPPTPPTVGPGFIRGTVVGPSPSGSGNDSLTTAPRVANAVITAYPVLSNAAGAAPVVGPQAGTATTGADGKFTMATIPGGQYLFTINPPANSPYGGVWSTTTIHPGSSDWPWWVVLWRKAP
jgi:hypothetical protein